MGVISFLTKTLAGGPPKTQAHPPGVGLKNCFCFSSLPRSRPSKLQCERQALMYASILEAVPPTVTLNPSFPAPQVHSKVTGSEIPCGSRESFILSQVTNTNFQSRVLIPQRWRARKA